MRIASTALPMLPWAVIRITQRPGWALRSAGEEVDAAHVGHLEVGQHHVEGLVPERLEGVPAVAGRDALVPLRFQDHLEDVPLVLLVVDDEDAPLHEATATGAGSGAGRVANGRTMRAVVPWPGSLSREIEPPWSSTILRVSARPSPSPVSFVEK